MSRPPIIAVHGFGYDARTPAHDPAALFLPPIAGAVGRAAEDVTLWSWYSYPPTLRDIVRAWRGGHWNRYRAAWAAARVEGRKLAAAARDMGQPVDLVAHSLGTEVARVAIAEAPTAFRRVILLAGAALVSGLRATLDGIDIAGLAAPRILVVASRDDDVLRYLGREFCPDEDGSRCIGEVGIGTYPGVVNVVLDNPAHQRFARARGWVLRGDQPREMADHKICYTWSGNHPLYQAWLRGAELPEFGIAAPMPVGG